MSTHEASAARCLSDQQAWSRQLAIRALPRSPFTITATSYQTTCTVSERTSINGTHQCKPTQCSSFSITTLFLNCLDLKNKQNKTSESLKNGLQPQLIRYNVSINVNAPNQSLTLSVNVPLMGPRWTLQDLSTPPPPRLLSEINHTQQHNYTSKYGFLIHPEKPVNGRKLFVCIWRMKSENELTGADFPLTLARWPMASEHCRWTSDFLSYWPGLASGISKIAEK